MPTIVKCCEEGNFKEIENERLIFYEVVSLSCCSTL